MHKLINNPIDLDLIIKNFYMDKRINEYYERELRIEKSKDKMIKQEQLEISNLKHQLKEIHNSKGWRILNLYYKIRDVLLYRLRLKFFQQRI